MKKTVVELFAGVGGFRLGLERSGDFEVVWANQYEPSRKSQDAFNCYVHHFKDRGIHSNEDISNVPASEIPDHTLLVGGFPCQDYSVARTQAEGIKGKKGVLFWEIERIIKEKKTPFLLLENVDRLLKSPAKQRGRDFAVMLTSLWNLGYGVEWRVVNAADYGFPQKRRRVFIFAYHKSTHYFKEKVLNKAGKVLLEDGFFQNQFPISGYNDRHPPKEGTLEEDIVNVSDTYSLPFRNTGVMINGEIYTAEVIPEKVNEATLLEDIVEGDVDEKYYLPEEAISSWKYLKDSKRIERVSKTGHKYTYSEGQMSFPDPLDRPARTMLTSESTRNRSSHVIEDPITKRLRTLTPLECERLNGFTDNWTNTGMSQRFRYFCMGNALVVGLIEKMGIGLKEIIENE